VVVYGWFFSSHFTGIRIPDAMDAAQVGRNISDGHGFTTSIVRPFSLAKAPRVERHPDLYNAPVYPFLLAIGFNLFGATERAMILLSIALALLTVILTYLLASRLLGPPAGALAALLVGLHPGLLKATHTGLNVAATAFFLTLLFYLIVRHPGARRWSVLSGVAFGVLYLTDFAALLFVIPAAALVYALQRSERLRHVGLFLVGSFAAVAPWLVRNFLVAGSPFAGLRSYQLAMNTGTYPLSSLYRHVSSSLDNTPALTFVFGHYREVARKTLTNLVALETTLPMLLGMVLLPLFGLALVLDLRSRAGNGLKWAFLAGLVLVSLNLAAGEGMYDLLYGTAGITAALGATAFVLVLRERHIGVRPAAVGTAAVLCLAALPIALLAVPGRRPSPPDRQNWEYLGRALPANAIVLTDQPWAVAWYANRTAIWIPQASPPEPDEDNPISIAEAADATRCESLQRLERAGVVPDAIFLSAPLSGWPPEEGVGRWQLLQAVIAQQIGARDRDPALGPPWTPPGWTLAATLPPADFLLLRADAEVPHEGVLEEGEVELPALPAIVDVE